MNPENENRITVAVPVEDYADLIARDVEHATLVDVLFESARLSYNRKDLSFNDEIINMMLKTFENYRYRTRLEELQSECDSTTIKV